MQLQKMGLIGEEQAAAYRWSIAIKKPAWRGLDGVRSGSLDVLDLLAHLLDQHLQLDGGGGDVGID